MADDIGLRFIVDAWSQTVSNSLKQWPDRQFRCMARPHDYEGSIEFVGGPDLASLPTDISIVRGEYKPDPPIERGIGVFAFYRETPQRDDLDGIPAFLGGWFWLPEATYDEIWIQAREYRYTRCELELEVGPVDFRSSPGIIWDVRKRNVLNVMRASVSFVHGEQQQMPD